MQPAADKRAAALARAETARLKRACGSQSGYDRLKSMAFTEAARVRRADSPALKRLASLSVVRMDQPVPRARDAALGVTVCSGRFVLELPPGAERLFAGDRRLEANVEYAAQDAADGSGPVYQMRGAEPIIYRLAAVGLRVREPVLLAPPTAVAATVPVVPVVPARTPSPPAPKLAAVVAPTSVVPKAEPTAVPVRTASIARKDMPTLKRVARADKPKARASVARAPARADSVRVASQKPTPKREKAFAVARRPSAKPVTRAVRAAAVKPRAATIKIAKAKSPKLRAAPVKLAGKAKAPSPPMRAAVVKPRPTLVKIAAKAKPRPVPAVAKRSAVRPMPLRMAMPRVAAPIRVSATRVVARPSFGCDDGLGRVERLICEDPWLARADRAMSTVFYRALDDADPFSRRELLRTRAVFLAFRDRCASARCVANAYADRIEEIRDITANR